MKKLFTIMMAVMVITTLSACSTTISKTTTTTTTVTDADGNSTTTTTTTVDATYPEGSCGDAAMDGESHEVSISIENATGGEMFGFYMCQTGETEWSNSFSEDQSLADGDAIDDFGTLTYSIDSLSWDLGYKNADGEVIECGALDISTLDATAFTITFNEDGCIVRGEFVK